MIAAAVGVALAAALAVIFLWDPTGIGSYDSNVSAYRVGADGYTLTLTASSGVCGRIVSASAEETSTRVRVSARAKDPSSPQPGCGQLVATNHLVTVRLKAPLGSRVVVNSQGYPISPAAP